MQLFKQLVIEQYNDYRGHQANKRFFPEEFYHAYALAATILHTQTIQPRNPHVLRNFNKKLSLYTAMFDKALNHHRITTDSKQDHKEAAQRHLDNLHHPILLSMEADIRTHHALLSLFFDTYRDVAMAEDHPNLIFPNDGVIAVVSPGYDYG